jgi:hypothetical protein
MYALLVIIVLAVVFFIVSFPAFVLAQRRGLKNPWVAFVPLLGLWIVLCESTGHSGWFSLFVFIPSIGGFVLVIWMAFELPSRHHRSRWWTLPLIIPGINLLALWFYAFTLPRPALIPLGAAT